MVLLYSCEKPGTAASVATAMHADDSLKIATAFSAPYEDADSIYTALKTQFGEAEATQDFLRLNYAKVLIMTGKLGQADTFLKNSISRAGFKPERIAHARYANLQAAIAAYRQNQETAIKYYKTALEIFENHHDHKNAASINFNIANIFLSRLDYPMAYQYSAAAVRGFKATKDTLYYPSALATNAVSAILLNKKDEAIAAAQQALDMSERYKNPLGMTMAEYALGEIDMHNEDYDAAIRHYEKAIPLARQLQQITVLSAASASLVKAYLEKESYDLVISEGKKAIDLSEKLGYKDVRYALHRYVSQAYDKKGNYQLSLHHLRQADEYFRDELISNNQRVMSELLLEYESEKKEKQLAEQDLKIQKQQSNLLLVISGGLLLAVSFGGVFIYNKKAQKVKLRQLQQEKENAILNSFILGEERERRRISHDLHDGVAAMIGAAKMSLESIPHLQEETRLEQLKKVRHILERSHADIRHIAHNLLPTVLEQEGLIAATEQFVSEINETQLIHISIKDHDSKAGEQPQKLQLMLFRIIQELLNNIIKHAQAKNAEIVFSQNLKGIQIEITDDGVGYDDTSHLNGQGLYSISQRLKSIGGNFRINKRKPGGTQARIVLVG